MPARRTGAALLIALATGSSWCFAQSSDPLAEAWTWLRDARQQTEAPDENPLQRAFDELCLTAEPNLAPELVPPAIAARVASQMCSLPPGLRRLLVDSLETHEELAAEVALLLGPEDDIPGAYRVLARLLEAHGDRVATLAPLAAAICAVHDRPGVRWVNENPVSLVGPVELFAYYSAYEGQMHFSLRHTPAEMLVHLADATGSIQELEWARERYAKDRNVGNRYREITYDTRAFRQDGVAKRVTESGRYTLESIRRHGGVCADQAYFAMTVGKAIGIPSCYDVGRGGEASHAWVGFLSRQGGAAPRWDFSAGRFGDFEDVRGSVRDPQSGATVPDAFLGVQGISAGVARERRLRCEALTDAASRLPAARASAGETEATAALVAHQLTLLEAALSEDPGSIRAWLLARDVLASPLTTAEHRQRWSEAIDRLAGSSHPDFAFEMFAPLFQAAEDPDACWRLWDWAATRYAARPDLAARARFEQARLLLRHDRKLDAGAAAWGVFEQFSDAGPIAVEALAFAAQMLEEAGRGSETLDLYERAWRKLKQPGKMHEGARAQSSWYRVGVRYAELLDRAGDPRGARSVRNRLSPNE